MKAKITKTEARYRHAIGSRRCSGCSMFSSPSASTIGKCSLVEGVIRPADVCRYWEAKKK